jgi:AraC family transcriptional regulator
LISSIRLKMNLNNEKIFSNQIVEYILTRDFDEMENLSVKTVARNFNISRFRLYRKFKLGMGMTLEEYILRVKLHFSVFFIISRNDLPIKSIAEKLGYYCFSYFIRIFKNYFGVTPGKFRKLNENRMKR